MKDEYGDAEESTTGTAHSASPDRDTARTYRETLVRRGPLWVGAFASILLFLFAVQLLGTATEAAKPLIERFLVRVVVGDGSALGLSWLVTYGLTNGSVVAALALSLFRSELVTVSALFLMIVGSRLGGSAIVILIGAFDYLQDPHRQSFSEGTSLGLLTFLITFTIYVPVAVLGFVVLRTAEAEFLELTGGLSIPVQSLQVFYPVTEVVVRLLGAGLALIVALAVLLASLWLFDELLERVHTETIRTYVFGYFERRWMAFAIGIVITALTTSVAFSLGVVVPLYNRKFVRRDEIVPYILGANIGTFFDTLVVAFVLETPAGVSIVLLVVGIATVLTVLALIEYDSYARFVDDTQNRLVTDRRYFVGFGVLLVVVPVILLAIPHC